MIKTCIKRVSITAITASFALSACGQSADTTVPKSQPAATQSSPPTATYKTTSPPSNVEKTATATDPLIRGKKLYKRCITCHTLNEGGKHKIGPNLWMINGMKAGSQDGFAYSTALKDSGIVWSDETLDGFLEKPSRYIPKNRMTFVGLKKAEDRKAVILYLNSQTTPKP